MINMDLQCHIKDSIFNKGYWTNWIVTQEKNESGHHAYTVYTKINSRCTTDLKVKGKTM